MVGNVSIYSITALTAIAGLIPLIWGIYKTKSASNFGAVGLLSLGVYLGQLAMYVLAALIFSGKQVFAVLYMFSDLTNWIASPLVVISGIIGYTTVFAVLASCFYVFVAEGS
jgi:hypothetical protein